MNAPVTIRRATVEDAAAVAAFGAKTFEDTFGADNRPEDMAEHLASAFGVPQQTAELASPDYVTLVAEVDGAIAAFSQIRRKTAPDCVTGPDPVELHRIYVDQPWHGQGLAQRLMAASLDAARDLGGRTVWLSVWERNPRGRAFYAKCGFDDVGTADFWVGPDRQTDRILARVI